jgi:hypothetical protein
MQATATVVDTRGSWSSLNVARHLASKISEQFSATVETALSTISVELERKTPAADLNQPPRLAKLTIQFLRN